MNAAGTPSQSDDRAGFMLGLGAYGLWGVLPLYFKAIGGVPAFDIVAHRVLWSLPLLALLITGAKGWPAIRSVLADRRTLGILTLTSILIGVNWLLYVWSVTNGHILASSFGYYLNPLANVLLGRFVLQERLSRVQWTAVAIAAAGISVLAAGALSQLWISLALCASFASYGLLRKIVAADAVSGLAVETAILFPVAIVWLGLQVAAGHPAMGASTHDTTLLFFAGIVSTTPLLLFAAAARRLPLSTMGMLQFIAPTLQFLIGVAYGEHLTTAHIVAFAAIWAAIALYVVGLLHSPRLPQPPE